MEVVNVASEGSPQPSRQPDRAPARSSAGAQRSPSRDNCGAGLVRSSRRISGPYVASLMALDRSEARFRGIPAVRRF